jgi:hypothetical protein
VEKATNSQCLARPHAKFARRGLFSLPLAKAPVRIVVLEQSAFRTALLRVVAVFLALLLELVGFPTALIVRLADLLPRMPL